MIIPPSITQTFYLHFEPIDLASYAFFLPLVINELLGPVLIENQMTQRPSEYLKLREEHYARFDGIAFVPLPPKLPTIYIDCTVAGHVISFSKLLFHFDVTLNKVNDELRIYNETHRETSLIIRTDDFYEPNCPFTIRWTHGIKPTITRKSIVCTLCPGKDTYFLIEYKPREQGSSSLEAPIFIRGELDGNIFNRLLLEGDNPVTSIDSDVREIYFSPLPLKTEIEEKFTLKLNNFKNFTTITSSILTPQRYNGNITNNVLQVKFPRGNVIFSNCRFQEIEVSILFKSEEPISFCTKIQFHDNFNLASFRITVYAISDNSLLTIHAFLRSSIKSYKVHNPEVPEASRLSMTPAENDEIRSLVKQVHTNESMPKLSSHSNVSQIRKNPSNIYNSTTKLKLSQINEEKDENDEKEEETDSIDVNSKISIAPSNLFKICKSKLKLTYPFFSISESTDYDIHMHKTMKAAEEWLYSGPLKFNFYPSIVDGITAVLSGLCSIETNQSDNKRKSHSIKQSFIDVLEALIGHDVYKYIGEPVSLPVDELDRVNYVLKTYENILAFMIVQGACLPHVSPQFLLNYNDYSLSIDSAKRLLKNLPAGTETVLSKRMPRHLFEARSKQCWLDVILQAYKIFVFVRVDVTKLQDKMYNATVLQSSEAINFSSVSSLTNPVNDLILEKITERASKNHSRPKGEALLLAWLEHHYEQQRQETWLADDRLILNPHEKRDLLQSRTLNDFENDLSDGLVLITVTAAYCPFLIEEYFNNVYICPRNPEEMLHNAICVVAAWQKIRLGFVISPSQITHPNCIRMLMLIVHLFQVLPTYVTRTKVKFNCPLTESVTKQMVFTNPSEFPVNYILQFLSNDLTFFSVIKPHSILHINPHNSSRLKLGFHARKIQQVKAYLLLCGSAIGPYFAKNQTFILEGCTNQLETTNTYNVQSKLYRVVDKTLTIRVPYKYAADYEIWMTEEQPAKPSTLKMIRWSDLRLKKVPRRLYLNQKSLFVQENAYTTNLSITLACITPIRCTFWLILQAKLGDFIIQINSKSSSTITDHIVVQWEREKCICPDPPTNIINTCPLNVNIIIPTRNEQLWKCISQMFQRTQGNSRESAFWSRHLDTNIGLRLIRWLMEDQNDTANKECLHIFNTNVTYIVTTSDKSSPLTVPTEFTIPDVRSLEEQIEMTVHILQSTPQVYETTMSFVSLDKKELRCYKIDFLCKTPTILLPAVSENRRNTT